MGMLKLLHVRKLKENNRRVGGRKTPANIVCPESWKSKATDKKGRSEGSSPVAVPPILAVRLLTRGALRGHNTIDFDSRSKPNKNVFVG